eukprot:437319-Pleurochrysis_carterae.AAC.2
MREEALRRIAENGNGPSDAPEQQSTPIAYRDPNQYPTSSSSGHSLKLNQTFVDGGKEAVLIPIFGRLVPFHISTIKNVSKSEEGVWTFLRINFVAPGGGGIAAQQVTRAQSTQRLRDGASERTSGARSPGCGAR